MPTIPEWLGGAAGSLAGIAALIITIKFFISHGIPAFKGIAEVYGAIREFLIAWNGTLGEEDHSGKVIKKSVPGVIARLQDLETGVAKIDGLEAQVEKIHHEVTPNHGGSMNDAQRRTETAVSELTVKLDQHIRISKDKDAEQERTAERVERLADRWADKPRTDL